MKIIHSGHSAYGHKWVAGLVLAKGNHTRYVVLATLLVQWRSSRVGSNGLLKRSWAPCYAPGRSPSEQAAFTLRYLFYENNVQKSIVSSIHNVKLGLINYAYPWFGSYYLVAFNFCSGLQTRPRYDHWVLATEGARCWHPEVHYWRRIKGTPRFFTSYCTCVCVLLSIEA